MIRCLLAVAVMAALSFGVRPALAFGDAPWCSVTTEGPGEHMECVYKSAAQCQPHVIGGNRGFCQENPFYQGPKKRSALRHSRKHGH
jgi:hypothetical protein